MASMEDGGESSSSHKKGPGVKKAKKLSTRVDMTPMVDLGFLLITFFIFTATLNSPATMDLNMPKDTEKKEDETKIKQSGALTVMLGKDNGVYFYEGELLPDGSNFKPATFKTIRAEIIRKKAEVIKNHQHDDKCQEVKDKAKKFGDPKWETADLDKDFFVVIKPNEEATYKNTVDMLDEMTINKVKRFSMIKISKTEDDLIKATQKK